MQFKMVEQIKHVTVRISNFLKDEMMMEKIVREHANMPKVFNLFGLELSDKFETEAE